MYNAGFAILCAGILSMTAAISAPGPGNVLFVTVGGGGDCQQTSPCTLTLALATAVDLDEIYLAGGSYADATIEIDKSLNLYGGWDGAGTGSVTTDAKRFVTVLDGEQTRRVMNITGPDEAHPLTVRLEGMTVRNGRIDEDNPAASGAGINALYTDLHLHNMVVEDNHLDLRAIPEPIPAVYENSYGGGLALDNGSLNINSSVFRKNNCTSKTLREGGAVFARNMKNTTIIRDAVFERNDAWEGSGIFFTGAVGILPAAIIENNKFISNGRMLSNGDSRTRGGYAGALYLSSANAYIKRNEFTDNFATNRNGAVYIYGADLVEMEENLLANNQSYIVTAVGLRRVSSFTLVNNVVVRNTLRDAWVNQPAVQFRESVGNFIHNTVVSNEGDFVIDLENATVDFTNNILGNGTVAGIRADAGSSLNLTNTLWGAPGSGYENGTNLINGGNLLSESGNLSGDPAFVDSTRGDYRLGPGSDALDAGIDAGITTDFHGQTRPAGAAPDIGADERMLSACSGATAEEAAPITYTAEYFCSVSQWIKSGDLDGGTPTESVTVSATGDVTYTAPEIMLFPGFRVEAPGKFRAGANANP